MARVSVSDTRSGTSSFVLRTSKQRVGSSNLPGRAIPSFLYDLRAQRGNRSDRILGSSRILGVGGGLPDSVFLYVELFDFQI